jgi:nitrogenase molybdenum-iron protein alpha/beta subunit
MGLVVNPFLMAQSGMERTNLWVDKSANLFRLDEPESIVLVQETNIEPRATRIKKWIEHKYFFIVLA